MWSILPSQADGLCFSSVSQSLFEIWRQILHFFQPGEWGRVNGRWLRLQIHLDSWLYFYLSSVANQLPLIPECLRMVLWRRRLLACNTCFCWHQNSVFAGHSSSKLNLFQIKTKPKKQSFTWRAYRVFWTLLNFFHLCKYLCHSWSSIPVQGLFAALVLMECLHLSQKYLWTLSGLEKMHSEFKFHTLPAFLYLRI